MINHEEMTRIITADGSIPYGVGIKPNPFSERQTEWTRRKATAELRSKITAKIDAIFEERFVTTPETCECIEAIVTMTDARQVLELGTCTGFGSLHMLRAIVGKPGAKVVSIDARPAHDTAYFTSPDIAPWFEHIADWTPQCLSLLNGRDFDLVFIDSDHSRDHTTLEIEALKPITHVGSILLFHDVPAWMTPDHRKPLPVRVLLEEMVASGDLRGLCMPSCEQADTRIMWGAGYPKECNPGLGIFIRAK